MTLLDVQNLRGDFSVDRGEAPGIVGESRAGKSVSMLAVLGLVDAPGRGSADALRFDGRDLLAMKPRERRTVVGKDIANVFQVALASLNPACSAGLRIGEVLAAHLGFEGEAQRQCVDTRAEVRFAHETGTTENSVSVAGIVRGIAPRRRHDIVALISNLGTRDAPGEPCATTWRIPALGAAFDAAIAGWLEGHA